MKKVLALIMAAALALSLVACGGNSSSAAGGLFIRCSTLYRAALGRSHAGCPFSYSSLHDKSISSFHTIP